MSGQEFPKWMLMVTLVLAACQEPKSPPVGAEGASTSVHAGSLSAEARTRVSRVLDSAEAVRRALAEDALEAARTSASTLSAALEAAAGASPEGSAARAALESALEESRALESTSSLETARVSFEHLQRHLVTLLASDPSLRGDWQVIKCPMTPGPGVWLQRGAAVENPYMGSRMLACGSALDWEAAGELLAAPVATTPPSSGTHLHAESDDSEIAFYTCPMHPSIRQGGPGQCPICGMDLVPVTRSQIESGELRVDPTRLQRIGVMTAPVVRKPLERRVRMPARVLVDETAVVEVTTRVSGFVQRVGPDAVGDEVEQGQLLYTLYSPELVAAQAEWLASRGGSGRGLSAALEPAARQRLQRWGVSDAQLAALRRRGRPQEHLVFPAPASGVVLDKDVVAGSSVREGERLFRLAPLSAVWVEAEVYPDSLAWVREGQDAEVEVAGLGGRVLDAKVERVYPLISAESRTGRVRLRLENAAGHLRPGQLGTVTVRARREDVLQVPREAVIFTGHRRLVFVQVGEGRLLPREVRLGEAGEEAYEIRSGLQAGDIVVTEGTFLISAESRLRAPLPDGSDGGATAAPRSPDAQGEHGEHGDGGHP